MSRKLLILVPALAFVVWGQETSTDGAHTEKALRAQVQKYYQLMMEEKYRQAEALVAEESKEDYYNGHKPKIKGFEILKTELSDDKTKATVTIKAKVLTLMMGAGAQIFEMPTPTHWKIENGEWRWYIPEEVKTQTPFGKLQADGAKSAGGDGMKGKAPGTIDSPDVGALQGQISIDKTAVSLDAKNREQSVTISNGLPGPLDLRIDPHVPMIKGLVVKAGMLHLESGAKTTVRIQWTGEIPVSDTVEIVAMPLNRIFDIRVSAK